MANAYRDRGYPDVALESAAWRLPLPGIRGGQLALVRALRDMNRRLKLSTVWSSF